MIWLSWRRVIFEFMQKFLLLIFLYQNRITYEEMDSVFDSKDLIKHYNQSIKFWQIYKKKISKNDIDNLINMKILYYDNHPDSEYYDDSRLSLNFEKLDDNLKQYKNEKYQQISIVLIILPIIISLYTLYKKT